MITMERDIGFISSQEGGEATNAEKQAQVVVQNNGNVLTDSRCRVFLTGIINDRQSARYDSNVNAFVARALKELKTAGLTISRSQALRLYRLFMVRDSQALKDAMKLREKNDQSN